MPATSPSAPSPGSGSARSPGLGVPRMDRLVQEIMKDVFDAYVDRDVATAVAARQRDEELDELYTSLFREVLTYMMEDLETSRPARTCCSSRRTSSASAIMRPTSRKPSISLWLASL